MKPSELLELLSKTIPAHLPILVTGAPGVGKSDIIAQAAAQAKADFFLEFPAISDPTDGKGIPMAEGNIAKWLPFERHEHYCSTDKLTVVLLDDLGQAAPAVQSAYMQWILARRIGDRPISPNVTFVAATNRRADRANVIGLLEPVKSRFASIVELVTDLDEWCKHAINCGMPTPLVAFPRFRPQMLHDFKPTQDLVNTPSPRTLFNVGRLMLAGIPKTLEYDCFSGAAGSGFAAEFCGFLKMYRSLVSPDLIMMNPEKAEVPKDPATLYALCGALSNKASDQTIDRLMKYFNRLPDEFSVLAVRDSVQKCPDITQSRAFIEWASNHSDVLI